jgi:hypothetical protein
MKKTIDRRSFIKRAGGSALAMTSMGALAGCGRTSGNKADKEGCPVSGEMTYRTNKADGDKVSILGYGCMRWPMIKNAEGKDIVDQETVNSLIDHALAEGVNYFDSAPVYLQGQCETATGEALSRHPRESYFIATSSPTSRTQRENSDLKCTESHLRPSVQTTSTTTSSTASVVQRPSIRDS